MYRGYVRPPGSQRIRDQQINIDRLGAQIADDRIDGVLVFWAATHPTLGWTRIVGWYDDATVYRRWRPSPKKRKLPDGDDAGFMVEASAARLLPSDDRTFILPRANARHSGIGQSNVWYAPPGWAKKLVAYRKSVLAGRSLRPRGAGKKPGRLTDTEQRLRIERAAMAAAGLTLSRSSTPVGGNRELHPERGGTQVQFAERAMPGDEDRAIERGQTDITMASFVAIAKGSPRGSRQSSTCSCDERCRVIRAIDFGRMGVR